MYIVHLNHSLSEEDCNTIFWLGTNPWSNLSHSLHDKDWEYFLLSMVKLVLLCMWLCTGLAWQWSTFFLKWELMFPLFCNIWAFMPIPKSFFIFSSYFVLIVHFSHIVFHFVFLQILTTGSTLLVAFAINKMIFPLRLATTTLVTPIIVKILKHWGMSKSKDVTHNGTWSFNVVHPVSFSLSLSLSLSLSISYSLSDSHNHIYTCILLILDLFVYFGYCVMFSKLVKLCIH
jgi:hypothetical protein